MTTKEKKERFYTLVVPNVDKIYKEQYQLFIDTKNDLKQNQNRAKIELLKKRYKARSDLDLLMAIKPHPRSIAIAQAAMESAWGTSRFFREANNIFGVWSANIKEDRVKAAEQRKTGKQIWLRKFKTLEESVREYYLMIARVKDYKEFRKIRYESYDLFEMVKALHVYSEKKHDYSKELMSIIKYNNLTKYDK